MNVLNIKNNELYCEEVSLSSIAEEVGTPAYVYSQKALTERYNELDRAFSSVEHMICYSVKVNSNLSVLKILSDEGAGFDVVSGGELFRVAQAGGDLSKVVFAGVGKTYTEIQEAIKQNIAFFTVESIPELERISTIAEQMEQTARIAVRVNPDVDPCTHRYITTGRLENKFGLDVEAAYEAYLKAKEMPCIDPVAIQMHIGSQIVQTKPYEEAVQRLVFLVKKLRAAEIYLKILDIGGGFGILYENEKPASAEEFAAKIVPVVKELELKLYLEPGRFIAGNSGVLLTTVQYVKKGPEKRFAIVDAGMNDLIRPSLYGAFHNITPVVERNGEKKLYDVVGPICESGDFFAKDRYLLPVVQGDILVINSAGAYGFVMSSNYNTRPRPPEILVSKDRFKVIRKREGYEDLIRGENE
ncbi:MAG: diaminopimelate decarboxylase [Candidatus Theseobacter exili]|nr:diaminopimelate decarboxylase [Candidatus Theseobacter exili]